MPKSATEVMQEIVVAAVLDAIMALKAGSNGLPNALLRDLNAIHANTTLADLPPETQRAITDAVRAAFARMRKEGYAMSGLDAAPPPRPRPPDPRRLPSGPGPRPPRRTR